MVISAWVATLASDAEQQAAAVDRLRAHPALLLGEVSSIGRLPLVAETVDTRSARDLLEALAASGGVVHVDVVGVYFADTDDGEVDSDDSPQDGLAH